MSDIKFIDGLIVKAPHEKAPDFVKAKLSIKRADLIAWLQAQEGEWINADIKESKGGKWYAAVDEWKPEQRGGAAEKYADGGLKHDPERGARARAALAQDDSDIPF